ncbi:MAG: M20 family metallopeptidase [Lentisphaerae bacterium]|nr:M20 family metallopeptidase [Lentisphaerota bacterium]
MDSQTELINLLSEMIRIDSRNSLPLDSTAPREATEQAMADCVTRKLQDFGFDSVSSQEIAPGRPNVLGQKFRCPEYPCLAFEAHLDTVGTQGMSIDPFNPTIAEGKIYGRGSCDTKGSLAAMLLAAREIIAADLPLNLLFLASSAEETGCEGALFWELPPCNLAGIIVGEPTTNQPIYAHKTQITLEFICRGKAAHASSPDAGDNAINKAARVVNFLEEKIWPEFQATHHPDFNVGNTLSVGLIQGGCKGNVVPDFCSLTCDFRLFPEQDAAAFIRSLQQRLEQGLGFPVELGYQWINPGMVPDLNQTLLLHIQAAMQELSLPCHPGTVPYCTDAGVLSQKGYPCIILGPGDILQAHTACEFLALDQLQEAYQLYQAVARQIARHGTT